MHQCHDLITLGIDRFNVNRWNRLPDTDVDLEMNSILRDEYTEIHNMFYTELQKYVQSSDLSQNDQDQWLKLAYDIISEILEYTKTRMSVVSLDDLNSTHYYSYSRWGKYYTDGKRRAIDGRALYVDTMAICTETFEMLRGAIEVITLKMTNQKMPALNWSHFPNLKSANANAGAGQQTAAEDYTYPEKRQLLLVARQIKALLGRRYAFYHIELHKAGFIRSDYEAVHSTMAQLQEMKNHDNDMNLRDMWEKSQIKSAAMPKSATKPLRGKPIKIQM